MKTKPQFSSFSDFDNGTSLELKISHIDITTQYLTIILVVVFSKCLSDFLKIDGFIMSTIYAQNVAPLYMADKL